MTAAGDVSTTPLSILLCYRGAPANPGSQRLASIVLEELGQRVHVVEDGPIDLSPFDVILLYGNPGYFPRMRRQLLATEREQRPLVATLHAEPLPPPRASGLPRWAALTVAEMGKIILNDPRATDIYSNHFKLRRMMREGTIDLLFAMSAEKQEYASEEGYESWHIPYGYHPILGRLLEPPSDRDVDVLFLGDSRPWRRTRLLRRLKRAGVDVTIRGSWYADGKGLWGDERTRFLNRTKIIIHVQRYPGKLASMRYFMAMANGVLVISEPAYKPEPFVNGEHYVAATIDEMPEVIKYYLAHPDQRERITAAAHRLVTEELSYRRSMEQMLGVIEERVQLRKRTSNSLALNNAQS